MMAPISIEEKDTLGQEIDWMNQELNKIDR